MGAVATAKLEEAAGARTDMGRRLQDLYSGQTLHLTKSFAAGKVEGLSLLQRSDLILSCNDASLLGLSSHCQAVHQA